MGRRFAELAFTPLVKNQQEVHGSRHQYGRVEKMGDAGDRLGAFEQEFLRARDGFYMATVSETGWPYVQYRGGPPGFVHVLEDQLIGFADLRGNRQYISTGNLQHDSRVALFFMDYAHQARLKVLGRATSYETGERAADLMRSLRVPGDSSPVERAVLIRVEAFDWNCQQHIMPRFTEAEIVQGVKPLRDRIHQLEEELARLRSQETPQAL